MTKTLKQICSLAAAICLLVSAFTACDNQTENESESETESGTDAKLTDFAYESADLSKYITLSESEYFNNKVTLGTDYIVSDEMLDEHIADLLFENKTKTNGDTQIVDQPIKLGDSAFIYYTGYLNGKAFAGGSNADDKKPHELSIGSGSFIPGFEDGLIGVIPNQTSKDSPFDLNVTFPENYNSAELAGKAVVFKVWIEYTVQYTIPELTDDFVKEALKFDGTASDYKAHVKEQLQAELTAKAEDEALNAVLNKLMENSEVIEYPKQSVDYYYESYIDYYEYYMQLYSMYGYKFDSLEEFLVAIVGLDKDNWQEQVTDLAKNAVQTSLICYSIAKNQNITVTDEEFNAYVETLIKNNSSESKQYTADEIIEMYGRQQINETLLFDKVNEFLLDNCTIEYKD